MSLSLSMPAADTVSYATAPKNAESQDVPDTLSWSASPDGLVTLTPDSASSLACSIKGLGAPGVVRVTVSDGHISDFVDITLLDETATDLGLHILSGPTP